jgi:hypothetical protein
MTRLQLAIVMGDRLFLQFAAHEDGIGGLQVIVVL